MNPSARTFTFIGLVIVILLGLHLLPAISVAGCELRPVNILSDILPEVYRQKYAIDVIPRPEPPKPRMQADTLGTAGVDVEEYWPEGVVPIDDYSEGQSGGMDHFYQMIDRRDSLGRPVRIAYYGDSFVEGDVFTAHLREQLQQEFGGCGVGWIDPGNKINGFRRTVRQRFKLFDEYEVVAKPFNHAFQGINQRYFVPREGASVWTLGTSYCPHAAMWELSTLYLRTLNGVSVDVCQNDIREAWSTKHVAPNGHVQQVVTACDTTRSISYRFGGVTHGTYVYGMSLEGHSGITLDNFSMRGSSGAKLRYMPADVLADFARLRPYDLIVLHFGLNVVSDRSHAANYKAYIKQMGTVIELLREAYPEASILVVSVPDRDQRTAAGVRTMNGIESLAAYQQILASNQHVAYFNLFKAMGGRESMLRLVERGLANKDYTHLMHGGGEVVSKHLYESLSAGYVNYQRHHHIP